MHVTEAGLLEGKRTPLYTFCKSQALVFEGKNRKLGSLEKCQEGKERQKVR